MKYQVPTGWVEVFTADAGFRRRYIFHEDPNCPRIRHGESLTPADRPGAAARCRHCSPT
jgi:hypothetical protein